MKKHPSILISLALGCLAFLLGFSSLSAQSLASREPQPKAVLLEEYTGVGCGNCPDGAKYAATLKDLREGLFHVIAIHAGGYAEPGENKPDYRTPYGKAFLELAGEYGYPQGTLDRTFFPKQTGDNIMAVGRGYWTKLTKELSVDTATVNMGISSQIDAKTRQLTLTVEAYYIKDVAQSFNLLNIALIQNHIIGPQSGGGNAYSHEHMLRDMITGQWGDTLWGVKAGSVITKTYTYPIPDSILLIPVDLRNLELVAFICQNKDTILQSASSKPQIINFEEPLKASLKLDPLPDRYAQNIFPIRVYNFGNTVIKTIAYTVTINGKSQEKEDSVMLFPYQEASLNAKVDSYDILEKNKVEIKLTKLNGVAFESNTVSSPFSGPILCAQTLHMELKTDMCGDEILVSVLDREGKMVKTFGPFEPGSQITFKEDIKLPDTSSIYSICFFDSWWDGYLEGKNGLYKIKDDAGRLVSQSYQIKDKGEFFTVKGSLGTLSSEKNLKTAIGSLHVYPNPIQEEFYLEIGNPSLEGNIRVSLCNMMGQEQSVLLEKTQIENQKIRLNRPQHLPKGFYFLKVSIGEQNQNIKVVLL